jgi:hypothetical protein
VKHCNAASNSRHQSTFLIFMVPCVMIQFIKMSNKLQLCRIIYCSLTALHVSNDIFVHHQEHLNCIYSFLYYWRVSLPADVGAEWERSLLFLDFSTCFERYFRSSSGVSQLYLQLLVLLTCVVAGWCRGWVGTPFLLSPDISRQQHTSIIHEAVNTVEMLLMMSENIARNM